jgi:hypothetical protein
MIFLLLLPAANVPSESDGTRGWMERSIDYPENERKS